MPWDAKKRSALVDQKIALARRNQRGQIRKAIRRDLLAWLEEQGIKLVKPQLAAWHAIGRRKTICLPWGRGVGKSFFLRLIAYLLIAQYDGQKLTPESPRTGIRIVWLMDTLKHFKDVHAKLLVDELEGTWAFLGAKIDRTTWEVKFPGGSWMQPFPALEHTAQAARGIRCDCALTDEGDDVPQTTYYSVARPWFTEPWSGKMRVLGGTPRKGRYGLLYKLHELGLDPEQTRHETFHATWVDAPEIVDPEEVKEAEAETPPAIFAREWRCEFDNPEGLVYPMWDPDFHVRECPVPMSRWNVVYVGVDWGYVHPGCFLMCVVTGKRSDPHTGDDTRKLWVVDEIYETDHVTDWWAEKAVEWREREAIAKDGQSTGIYPIAEAQWVADPAEPGSIADLRQKAKIKIKGGLNPIHRGVRQVASLLNIYGSKDEGGDTRIARLFVSRRCVNTIREFSTYRRVQDPRDADKYTEEIKDENNHCLVGSTLVTTARGQVPIKDVVVGDKALTRRGWQPITWSGQTFESAPLWRAELSTGETIEGTGDHRVWVQGRGWTPLAELREKDQLLCPSTGHLRSSNLTARDIDAIPSPRIGSCASTSRASGDGGFIGTSGRQSMALSPMGTPSTTSTRTRSTTSWPTYSASRPARTCRCMVEISRPSSLNSGASTARESALSPKPGTEALPARHGMPNRARPRGHSVSLRAGSVCSVAQTSRATPCGTTIASAPTSARRRAAAHRESMTSTGPAPSAVRHSASTGTRRNARAPVHVLHVSSLGRSAAVYDLTVSCAHEFFANGVLVHNSMDPLRYVVVEIFGLGDRRRHVVSSTSYG